MRGVQFPGNVLTRYDRPHREDLLEWEAPAIVLDLRPYGEGDAVATVMTAEHGAHRGLARGAQSRARRGVWQVGNLVSARWVARLSDQLGSLTAELVHPAAALAMEDALSLAILASACALAEGALPEREPHPRAFDALVRLIAALPSEAALTDYVHWELLLLAELGYGLDLSSCAVTGTTESLAYVSPRTGRAVSDAAAGVWRERLLPLPAFLTQGSDSAAPADWAAGLRLAEHFLARDAFGHRHRPLPAARLMLRDRVERLVHAASGRPETGDE
jgi:DNA repair protein RecO (recombination protein O)